METNCRVPIVGLDELEIGRMLGRGGFSSVTSVCLRDGRALLDCEEENIDAAVGPSLMGGSSRAFSTSTVMVESSLEESEEYAMKKLHHRTLGCQETREMAFYDLHSEVNILSQLPHHPNINPVRAISECFWTSPETAFIVLDRLSEPLDKTLTRWKQEAVSGWKRFRRTHRTRESQVQRVRKVAIGVASALAFLHGHGVMYRDVKPANIGFDRNGTVRLFDFGLSKKVDLRGDGDESSSSSFLFTIGRIGTLRYMAPEVARCEEYGFSADVHSFGTLLWEICALAKPFGNVKTRDALAEIVMMSDKNPSLSAIAPVRLKELLGQCWHFAPLARPSFASILATLKAEVQSIKADKGTKNMASAQDAKLVCVGRR